MTQLDLPCVACKKPIEDETRIVVSMQEVVREEHWEKWHTEKGYDNPVLSSQTVSFCPDCWNDQESLQQLFINFAKWLNQHRIVVDEDGARFEEVSPSS